MRRQVVAVLLWVAACGGDDTTEPAACLTTLPVTCEASLPTTYDVLYEQVIAQRCGVSGTGTSCHGRTSFQGGLSLADPQAAYDALLGGGDAHHPRVIPGDPACSPLMQRVESQNAGFRMPLGENPLSAGVRCTLQQWIAGGASR